jgi:16S rRNA (cytidine1402-2'-O)-methyltransferase
MGELLTITEWILLHKRLDGKYVRVVCRDHYDCGQGGEMAGVLYVIATPIGNLGDITLRAVEVLSAVDVVIAESRERALKLLSHLNIRKRIITISSYTEERRAGGIIVSLESGSDCALVTGAGTPCISDPGAILVRKCIAEGIEVRAVPGPSAVGAAVSISGLHADRFLFYGFLPLRRGKKVKALKDLLPLPFAMVFYESPRRLRETLGCMAEVFGEREAAVFKEITKLHEEVMRGTLSELTDRFDSRDVKGEYAILVEGAAKTK